MSNQERAEHLAERITLGLTVVVSAAPLELRSLEEPSMPVWGARPHSDWYHLTVLAVSFIALCLAVARLKRKLQQQHLGYVMAVLIMSLIPLVLLAPLLGWLVGFHFLVMIIPYSLLATSFFVPSRPR